MTSSRAAGARRGTQGPWVFTCNHIGCAHVIQTRKFDFRDALASIKEGGWSTYRVDDDWRHACPEHTVQRVAPQEE